MRSRIIDAGGFFKIRFSSGGSSLVIRHKCGFADARATHVVRTGELMPAFFYFYTALRLAHYFCSAKWSQQSGWFLGPTISLIDPADEGHDDRFLRFESIKRVLMTTVDSTTCYTDTCTPPQRRKVALPPPSLCPHPMALCPFHQNQYTS